MNFGAKKVISEVKGLHSIVADMTVADRPRLTASIFIQSRAIYRACRRHD